MHALCSFTYAAFTLAVIYFVLLILVVRYLANLIAQGSVKKRAQKAFLVLLIAQTTLRVVYFIAFPLVAKNTCDPSLKGDPHDRSGAMWWVHLLSNVPAALFLLAFSVLVYTFARIYHRVLLAGIWYQERRFNALTIVLIFLNVVVLVATFGDWAYAASSSGHIAWFADMLMLTVLSVSFILAIFFLAYGGLLYYQVQNIIRASAENVGSTAGGSHASAMYNDYEPSSGNGYGYTHKPSVSGFGAGRYKTMPLPYSNNDHLPQDVHSGFTPILRRNGMHGGEHHTEYQTLEGHQQPASASLHPYQQHNVHRASVSTMGFGSPVRSGESPYPISGFASPNLPIKNGPQYQQEQAAATAIAHSYVHNNSNEGSYSPEARVGIAAASADLLAPIPSVGPDGQLLPANASSAIGKLKHEPVALAQAIPHHHVVAARGVHSLLGAPGVSVSPEYTQLPSSAGAAHRRMATGPVAVVAGSTTIAATGAPTTNNAPDTPTDQLVGSMPYEYQQTANGHTPNGTSRRPMSSLSRPPSTMQPTSVASSRNGFLPLSHSPPEQDDDDDDDEASVTSVPADHRVFAIARGLTNATVSGSTSQVATFTDSASAATTASPAMSSTTPYHATDDSTYEGAYLDRSYGAGTSSLEHSLLGSGSAHASIASVPPPNPMRKIAVIAGICTVCLLLRTGLLGLISAVGDEFTWYSTLTYFALSEILPLLAMLKVFNTPTPLVHVLGTGPGF